MHFGIINYITRLHLVWISNDSSYYIDWAIQTPNKNNHIWQTLQLIKTNRQRDCGCGIPFTAAEVRDGASGGRGTHFGPQIFEQTQKESKRRKDAIPIWTANRKWCLHILDPKYGGGTPENPDCSQRNFGSGTRKLKSTQTWTGNRRKRTQIWNVNSLPKRTAFDDMKTKII
jgi:hypothetical protein